MSTFGCAQIKTTIGLSFLVMLFVASAAAMSPGPPLRLRGLTASGGRVAFIQPDGTPTILELATGTVVQRGGEPPAGWPAQFKCELEERKSATCTFATGAFTWREDSGGERFLEGRTEQGPWAASYHVPGSAGRSLRLWAVDAILLFEIPIGGGIDLLGGIDVRSGRGLWVYLYPSESSTRSLSDSETVRLAREHLDQAAFRARQFPLDYANYGPQNLEPRSWTVVLDPDPQQARKVERTSATAWAMLCAAVIASLLSLLTPRGALRTTFAFAVVGAVGILILTYRHIDDALTLRLWIGFLIAAWIGAAATSRPRSRNVLWCLVVGTAGLFALASFLPGILR